MSMTMRVSLPGYDALTDGTIDHYSIYADSDNVLIKEKERGTIGVDFSAPPFYGTITHNLGYIPLYYVYGLVSSNRYRIANAYFPQAGNNWRSWSGTTELIINNAAGTAGTIASYFLFYDNIGLAI